MALQKAGGLAALFEALAYVVGFAVMATLLNPADTQGWTSAQKLTFLLDKKAVLQAWNVVIYVAFGVALVVLTMALHERLGATSRTLMSVATPFGLIWAGLVVASGMVANVGLQAMATLHARDAAQAASAWAAISAVHEGLGGGIEVIGGLWVIFVTVASFRSKVFPRGLDGWGFVVGVAGILTVVPPLRELGAVFGLGQIVWFAWIGILLLRS